MGAVDNFFVSRLYAVDHDIVVADDLADLERLLVDHVSTFLVSLSDKSEIEAADSRHSYDRNNRLFLAAPNHTGADELGSAQAIFRVCDGRFGEHGLRRGIYLRRDERDAAGREH